MRCRDQLRWRIFLAKPDRPLLKTVVSSQNVARPARHAQRFAHDGLYVQLVFNHRSQLFRATSSPWPHALRSCVTPAFEGVHEARHRFLLPGAKQAITTKFRQTRRMFVQRDRSCTYLPLSQVKGFTVPTGMIAPHRKQMIQKGCCNRHEHTGIQPDSALTSSRHGEGNPERC